MRRKTKIEFGDFQTPRAFTEQVCQFLREQRLRPSSIVEPTCGVGNFVLSALSQFPSAKQLLAFDLNDSHLNRLRNSLPSDAKRKTRVCKADFFEQDWKIVFHHLSEPILALGNPPWVTNAGLRIIGGTNLPEKTNFQQHSGLEAITGKSNFDISEWMLIRLAEALQDRVATMAMLCKSSVARKFLGHAWKNNLAIARVELFGIDAVKHFDVAVDACLIVCQFQKGRRAVAAGLYPALDQGCLKQRMGYRAGRVVADVDAFELIKHLCGQSAYRWRSGVKHDCASVMELRRVGNQLYNGLDEPVKIEPAYLYPMLKSSEVANGISIPSRWMVLTQKSVGDETRRIEKAAPKTWRYLMDHAVMLDDRKSSIYRGRPRFSVFGVGEYTFAPWKIAISGLYKKLTFTLIGPHAGKPVVLDDTSYSLSFEKEADARRIARLLRSSLVERFFAAFVFWDSKRPITVDLLSLLNIDALTMFLEEKSRRIFTGSAKVAL